MLRTLLVSASLAAAGLAAVPVMAADAPAAPAAAPGKLTVADSPIGTLLDNPAAKAVLQKHLPELISNPQIEMARTMTLKQVQGYAGDAITDAKLAEIDADLAKIPAK